MKYRINENLKLCNLSLRVLELQKSKKFIISNSLELMTSLFVYRYFSRSKFLFSKSLRLGISKISAVLSISIFSLYKVSSV